MFGTDESLYRTVDRFATCGMSYLSTVVAFRPDRTFQVEDMKLVSSSLN